MKINTNDPWFWHAAGVAAFLLGSLLDIEWLALGGLLVAAIGLVPNLLKPTQPEDHRYDDAGDSGDA